MLKEIIFARNINGTKTVVMVLAKPRPIPRQRHSCQHSQDSSLETDVG